VHEPPDAAAVALSIDEREAVEPVGTTGHDPGDAPVRLRVVGVERGEEHATVDASFLCALQIPFQWRRGVPGPSESVALAGVAVCVDDHAPFSSTRRSSARSRMLVSTADQNVGKCRRSFGPWAPSSGRAKPINRGLTPSASRIIGTAGIVPPARTKCGGLPKPARYAATAAASPTGSPSRRNGGAATYGSTATRRDRGVRRLTCASS